MAFSANMLQVPITLTAYIAPCCLCSGVCENKLRGAPPLRTSYHSNTALTRFTARCRLLQSARIWCCQKTTHSQKWKGRDTLRSGPQLTCSSRPRGSDARGAGCLACRRLCCRFYARPLLQLSERDVRIVRGVIAIVMNASSLHAKYINRYADQESVRRMIIALVARFAIRKTGKRYVWSSLALRT